MGENRWLPANYELADGSRIRNLYVSGKNWQLYVTSEDGQVLAVDDDLHQAWLDGEWLEEGIFIQEENGYYLWHAHHGSLISSVEYGPYPTMPAQAESFVRALKRSREQAKRMSFADALYIAQFSVLMPTFSGGAPAEDALVLGRWLTGGINAPVTDTIRMRRYAPWLTVRALDRILESMGLTADAGAAGVLDAPAAAAGPAPSFSPRKERAPGGFSLPGRPDLERFFREEVLDVLDREDEYRRMGIGFPGPILLYGPPGCGKTFAVERLTEHLGWPVFEITSGTIGSKYIHETSRKISELFDSAIANAPSVIVIDELEAFLSAREAAQTARESHLEEVAEFLRRISDVGQHHVLLFGMTNMLDAIDKAILRRGRFDHVLEVGMPSKEEITSLLEKLLEPVPTDKDLPLSEFAGELSGCPVSDVAFVVREAGRIAVRARCEQISAEHLKMACERVSVGKPPVRRIGF